ncbi:SDR family oxidoreductase [uncultured Hoeflea sp.]|uniref:SDR family oxidoreductase n=1 Tax=uncultured Hoeflea sp. TaxID=538666 RepID=UPI002601CF68|nr:SDR family oxidoreductase [uncultured Hoeflea sp.]
MVETVLVAGATGTNGRALIEALRQRSDIAIRALVRTDSKSDLGAGIETAVGDLADPASLASAFQDIEKAYVVTAVQPDTVALFQNFFDAAQAANVRHVVKFSGLGASHHSPSEIIRQHAASDDALRASGLPFTILRPNSFHQNMLGQADEIARSGRFHLPLADARQSTIDVRDLAEITATILTTEGHAGRTYDLTGPESLNFHDVARIIGDVRGDAVEYIPVTPEQMEAALRKMGLPAWSAHALAEIQALFATGAYSDPLPDAERLLGRAPTPFRQFAQDHVDAWRASPAA